jgi:hypothetical protein
LVELEGGVEGAQGRLDPGGVDQAGDPADETAGTRRRVRYHVSRSINSKTVSPTWPGRTTM